MGKHGRTFGQDMLDNEGGVRLARGVRRSTGAQPVAGQPGKAGRMAHHGSRTAEPDPVSARMAKVGKAKSYNTGVKPGTGKGSYPDQIVGNRNSKANAAPSGGGGGIWKREQERLEKNRRELAGGDPDAAASGTSIFDPVLCELIIRWFCPPGGLVFDPFAGGSVRGVVASRLGRGYLGVDLRPEQVAANLAQLDIAGKPAPRWVLGDARNRLPPGSGPFDLVFSCPPYGDLEVYSDDPADLSRMDGAEFYRALEESIANACEHLKDDRFACFVVGDYRDKHGLYRNLPGRTIEFFEAAGLRLYNDAVLVTAAGSLPVRARKQFEGSRKLGKTHQNVLVFVKGDPKAATAAIGPVEFNATGEPGAEPAEVYRDERPTREKAPAAPRKSGEHTPIEEHGGYLVKRDDLFEAAGVRGGKVRTCWQLAQGAVGLVTAGARASPQVNIVAQIAKALGVPCRVHIPSGQLGPELIAAREAGAEVVQHKAGYNSVIVARARDDAKERGWTDIPFGMECLEAVEQTAGEVASLPFGKFQRIVIPVGSGMSLAGVLAGLDELDKAVPVLGVVVGADPKKRLDKYAAGWRRRAELVPAGMDYHKPAAWSELDGLALDPIYEAKCLPFLVRGDLLWVVGIRQT